MLSEIAVMKSKEITIAIKYEFINKYFILTEYIIFF